MLFRSCVDEMLVALRSLALNELQRRLNDTEPQAELWQHERQQAARTMNEAQRRLERLALAVADGTIDPRAARAANDTLVAEYDGARARIRELDERLAMLPDTQERIDAVLSMLDDVPSVRDVPLEVARRALLDAGVRIWCEDGEIVRVEIGAY